MKLSAGASASVTTIKECGSFFVSGTANSTTVFSGGTLRVEKNGTANCTTINAGGLLWVDNDGIGNDFTISNGGRLQVNADGKITGWMKVYDGAAVSVYGAVDFDLTKTSAGATSSLLNNLYLLDNSGPSIRPNAYTLTVDATQSTGTYKLADGGNDVIVGGADNDTMHGGGNDTFTFGGEWGNDTVEQLDGGSTLLWFEGVEREYMYLDRSLDDYAVLYCANGSVKLLGVNYVDVSDAFAAWDDELIDGISLRFGDDGSDQYSNLHSAGAFYEFSSEKIFEDKNFRMLA